MSCITSQMNSFIKNNKNLYKKFNESNRVNISLNYSKVKKIEKFIYNLVK